MRTSPSPLSLVALPLLLALTMALVAVLLGADRPARAQVTGGPVFVSGDDAEDHCEDTECGGLYVAVLNSAVDLSRSPGSGIAAIGMEDEDNTEALESWNDPANGGPDVPITVITEAEIPTADFADFAVIFVPSNEDDDDEVGIDNSELVALNARQADIQHFVNNLGGGLIALTEASADPALAFGFLPIPLEFLNVDYIDVEPTAALADLAPDADSTNMDHDNWHNIWTGPPGFGGLEVLAVTPEVLDDDGNPSAAILGGAQVTLVSLINLTPETATNSIGENHTVTATVGVEGDPFEGVDVTFEVIDGPNAGETATATTNASGQATFTYTGDGAAGTDTIEGCFTDESDQERCDTATKTWVAPEPGAPTPTTVAPSPTEEVSALPLTGATTSGDSDGTLLWLAVITGALGAVSAGGIWLARLRRRQASS